MRKWRRRPLPWPTICTAPILAVLIGFGMWQLERLEWKRGLIDQRAAALIASPIDFNDQQLAEIDFVKVRILGRFRHDDEVHLVAPPRRGQPACQAALAPAGHTVRHSRGKRPRVLQGRLRRRSDSSSPMPLVVGERFATRSEVSCQAPSPSWPCNWWCSILGMGGANQALWLRMGPPKKPFVCRWPCAWRAISRRVREFASF